jgi:molybdopterin-containing oxidoreductase family membrane subunit
MQAGWGYRLLVAILVAVIGWAAYAYSLQLRYGLAVTGLSDQISWGIYVTNFVFFIGISHAGTLISAILRVTGAEWRRPVTRMAEAITVFALLVGAPMVVIDLGRPERVLHVLEYGRLYSPILWDVISISTYLTGSLLYLYLPMIPDLAELRDLPGVSAWKRRLYRALSLGWKGTESQQARLERAIGAMAIVIIPVAVSVHTVVSWIFGMTLRAGWHSTIFGPYFVVGAIFSGIAAIIVAMALFRSVYRLERFLTATHFRNLGYLLLTLDLVYIYFTVSEYLTAAYGGKISDAALVSALLSGPYAYYFWGMVGVGLLLPAFLLVIPSVGSVAAVARIPVLRPAPAVATTAAFLLAWGVVRAPAAAAGLALVDVARWALPLLLAWLVLSMLPWLHARPVATVVIASILVNVGMWLKRYVIVVPSMALPLLPLEWARYRPTWVEWSITAGAFAAFVLMYLVFSRVFPVISLWEVRAGRHRTEHHGETDGLKEAWQP